MDLKNKKIKRKNVAALAINKRSEKRMERLLRLKREREVK
jgi:hypothetical protein